MAFLGISWVYLCMSCKNKVGLGMSVLQKSLKWHTFHLYSVIVYLQKPQLHNLNTDKFVKVTNLPFNYSYPVFF